MLIDLVENHVTEEFQQVAIARLRPRRVEIQSARKHEVSVVLVVGNFEMGKEGEFYSGLSLIVPSLQSSRKRRPFSTSLLS